MNKTQVTTLWGIALALGAGVAALKFSQSGEKQLTTKLAPGDTLLGEFPAADVSSLKIESAEATVNVTKKDGKWTVAEREGYPARTAAVNELIRGLAELKITRGIEAGPSFAPRFGMDPEAKTAADRGLTATLTDVSGKELAKVSLGKNIENNPDASPMGGGGAVGRYVRNHADESGFYATSEMFYSANADPTRWLDETFIAPEKITSISITKKDSEEIDWSVSRDTEEGEFKLNDAKPDEVLNTTVATPLKNLLSYARFSDVVNADKVADRSAPNGKRRVEIKTIEGFSYKIQITPSKAPEKKEGDDAAAPQDELLVTVEVSAELPKERKKEEGEKEEDAKTKDEAFKERSKTLSEKLEKEKALAGRTFLVSKSTFDSILKERSEMVTKPQPTPAAGTPATQTPMSGGTVVSPSVQAGGRVQAVTPPIEVPAMPKEESAEETQSE